MDILVFLVGIMLLAYTGIYGVADLIKKRVLDKKKYGITLMIGLALSVGGITMMISGESVRGLPIGEVEVHSAIREGDTRGFVKVTGDLTDEMIVEIAEKHVQNSDHMWFTIALPCGNGVQFTRSGNIFIAGSIDRMGRVKTSVGGGMIMSDGTINWN